MMTRSASEPEIRQVLAEVRYPEISAGAGLHLTGTCGGRITN